MAVTIPSRTMKVPTACGHINITYAPMQLLIVNKGKVGGCVPSLCNSIGRLAHELICLGDVDKVIDILEDVHCPSPHPDGKGGFHLSCADAIANALREMKGEN